MPGHVGGSVVNLANIVAHEAMIRSRPRRHGFVLSDNVLPSFDAEQVQHGTYGFGSPNVKVPEISVLFPNWREKPLTH